MNVGFIGAGRMGTPMVGRLVAAGHTVKVLGRTPEKCSSIEALGAEPVPSVAEAAAGADVVVLCVFTDEQVREICFTDGLLAAMAPGSVLVVHTTGSPQTAEALGAEAREREVDVLDAPVSGGPHDIAAGRVTLFVGGAAETLERARPVLACYGDPILHVGPLGSGQKVKLINNTVFAAQLGVVAEAVRLAAELGVTEGALLEALPHGSGDSRALAGVRARGSVSAFIEMAGGFVGKDVDVVRRVVAELGAGLGPLDRLVDAGLNAGTGAGDR